MSFRVRKKLAWGKAKWYYRKGRVLRLLRKKKYGLATACIGGGQGIAMVVESFQ
jgi:Thiolase, C-terminal domain